MEQPLNFLSFLSKDRLASHRRSFTFLGSGGLWRSVPPPQIDGGCVGGQLCSSHISPPPSPFFTPQSSWRADQTSMRVRRCDLDPPDIPQGWDSQTFFATGDPCFEVGQFLWPLSLQTETHLSFRLWLYEGNMYTQAEQKLNQVTAVCRLAVWISVDLKSETCCWKLPGS